jgi:hypothetical protein
MKRELESVIIENPEFNGYEAKIGSHFAQEFILHLQNKYFNNRKILVEALLSKKQENPIDFSLSFGSNQEEMIHHLVMSKGN